MFECTHLCSPQLPLGPGLTISVPTAAKARGAEKGNRGTARSRCQRSPPPTLPASLPLVSLPFCFPSPLGAFPTRCFVPLGDESHVE